MTRKSREADAILKQIANTHQPTLQKVAAIRRAAYLGPDPAKDRTPTRIGPAPIARLIFGALAHTDLQPDTPFTRTQIAPPNPFVSDVATYTACIGLVQEGYFGNHEGPAPRSNKPGVQPLRYTANRQAIEELGTGLNGVQLQALMLLGVDTQDKGARALQRVAKMDYNPEVHHPAVVINAWLGLVAARGNVAGVYDGMLGKLTQPSLPLNT